MQKTTENAPKNDLQSHTWESFFDNSTPIIAARLSETGEVVWEKDVNSGIETAGTEKIRKKMRAFKQALQALLEDDRDVWTTEERRQAIGLSPPLSWIHRTLLLCRVQVKAIEQGITSPYSKHKYIALADGQIINTKFFWPPQSKSKLKNPLTRLPEVLTLYAINEILKDENKILNDAALGPELSKWFLKHGASNPWLCGNSISSLPESAITKKDVENFRSKLNDQGLGFYLPKQTTRKRSGNPHD